MCLQIQPYWVNKDCERQRGRERIGFSTTSRVHINQLFLVFYHLRSDTGKEIDNWLDILSVILFDWFSKQTITVTAVLARFIPVSDLS